MTTVREHYNDHLGPVYSWMVGDVGAAMERGRAELRALEIQPGGGRGAVDLGAGPGLHAIPLAELGFSVLALDACAPLVAELRGRAGELPIRAEEADLVHFRQWLDGAVDVILCMGDTLTHLPRHDAVDALVRDVAESLGAGGVFAATFRDYTTPPPEGPARFIPVRSDEGRIHTCFLEYAPETVMVYDLIHERTAAGWELKVSSYPKLRLSPRRVVESLAAHGLAAHAEPAGSGMVRVVGRRG